MSLTLAAGFLGIEHFTPPWDVFFLPLFNLLVLAYRLIFSDFALAIIVFTVVVRTILAPLFVQQIRSQREMQRMQPLIREVQRKHKGNTQKITQETQALYREHGVNPFGGCLPLVLQLPILYSLYQALIRASGVVQGFTPSGDAQTSAFESLKSQHVVNLMQGTTNHYQVAVSGPCNLDAYNHLPQFLPLNCQLLQPLHLDHAISTVSGWLLNPFTGIHLDLAQPDHVFALVVPGTTFAISLIAILAAILQFVQVKMTSPRPNPDDPTTSATSTMTYVFPLLTVFWGGLFPSGLILYWVLYTGYLVGHQFLMMGWGNLFPIFGWNPSWGGGPADLQPPSRRGSGQAPDPETPPRSTGSRPPSPSREPAGTPSATGASRSTSTAAGQRANPGERASAAQRPGPSRGGRSKKRGRRR